MRKLWSLRQGAGDPIENFLGYAATAAEHGCYAFLRRQYPERTRFRNRVRYAAAHHPGTRLTRDGDGVWRCHTRQAVRRAPAAGATRVFLDGPRAFLAARRIDMAAPLPTLLNAVLANFDQAVEPIGSSRRWPASSASWTRSRWRRATTRRTCWRSCRSVARNW